MTGPDPYAPYLRQADVFFAQGEIVKAGQIWQAVLKRSPGHEEARAGLLKVKQSLEAQKAPPPPPVPAEELDRLLREGCTLYDMGQVEDALSKWDRLLSLAPHHAMAREYADGARRELGLTPAEPGVRPGPPAEEVVHAPPAAKPLQSEDLEKLLREAVQLYDMGLPEEAIAKWEKALALEPHRMDIQGYIAQAKAELHRQASAPTRPTASPSAPTKPVSVDVAQVEIKIRQGEHLLSLQRHEEAVFTFRQALDLHPEHPGALEGLRRAQAGAPPAMPAPARDMDPAFGLPVVVDRPAHAAEASAAHLPNALTKTLPPRREGLRVPSSFDRVKAALERYPQLREPKVLAGLAGGLLLFFASCSFIQGRRLESRRRDAVESAAALAVAEVAREAQPAGLNETASEVKAEAQEALGAEPLLAYLRAEYLVKISPDDGAAAQLFHKAQGELPGGAAGASLAEAKRHLQDHNLEAAAKVFDALVRAAPDNAELRSHYAHLLLALASAYAGQEKWSEARARLLTARALQPGDRTFALRLRMLDMAQKLPRGPQRESWLAFLG